MPPVPSIEITDDTPKPPSSQSYAFDTDTDTPGPRSSLSRNDTPIDTPTPNRFANIRGLPDTNPEHEIYLWERFPSHIFNERARDARSWTWLFGFDVVSLSNTRKWICKPCIQKKHPNPKCYNANGMQNTAEHLFTAHKITAPPGSKPSKAQSKAGHRVSNRNPSVAQELGLDLMDPTQQRIANNYIRNFDVKHFQRLLVEFIVAGNHTFSLVDEKPFRSMLEYGNSAAKRRDAIPGRTAIAARLRESYNYHKDKVIKVLREAPGLVHISFDGWRSPNRLNLYGIACFFRDENNRPCKLILGVPELTVAHTGANIASQVAEIIEEFGIHDKVGYFTLDNASSNDTAMDELGIRLGFQGRERRGRCFGHILNLSAKALLFGGDAERFADEVGNEITLSDAEHALWRRKGPVGKLHNLVHKIFNHDNLTHGLRALQDADPTCKKTYKVILDNVTRWLSQYYMMKRALHLRRHIELLIFQQQQEWQAQNANRRNPTTSTMPFICKDENKLTESDWDFIQVLTDILERYEDTILILEGDGMARRRKKGWTGSYGCIWHVLLGFEYLLEILEEHKASESQFENRDHFRLNVNAAWAKLNDYYSKLDETPIYYVSLALHPAFRWGWFEKNWADNPDWITTARDKVEEVWTATYKQMDRPGLSSASREGSGDRSPDGEPPAKRTRLNGFMCFAESSRTGISGDDLRGVPEGIDEYQHWQMHPKASDVDVTDPIGYWHECRERYPQLSRMALDFLTVQPMSAECERLFSGAGQMVRPQRGNLEANTIGMCQVLRSWLRAGAIKDLNPIFYGVAEEERDGELDKLSDDKLNEWAKRWLTAMDSED